MFEFAKKQLGRHVPARWQAMIEYALYLHEGAIHAPHPPLPYSWHDGCNDKRGLYFGVFEAIMAAFDFVFIDPKFAKEQIYNIISLQTSDGKIPARLDFLNDLSTRPSQLSSIPLWPWVVEILRQRKPDICTREDLLIFYQALQRQITWFERHRKSQEGGFFYLDIHDGFCESGYGIELRFLSDSDEEPIDKDSCIDATCQVYALYDFRLRWARELNLVCLDTLEKHEQLADFIQNQLYDKNTRFFYDQWHLNSSNKSSANPISCLGLWPIFTRSATPEQAISLVREYVLSPRQFYCSHPLATLSQSHPSFGPVGWFGPVRNSHLLWLTLGLKGYGLSHSIAYLIERALEHTFNYFLRTQTLWEFYHPNGGHPQELIKITGDDLETPLPNHLTHNPLIALTYLLSELRS